MSYSFTTASTASSTAATYIGDLATSEPFAEDSSATIPINIFTVSTIRDIYIDSDGFMVATVNDVNLSDKYKDGWPIYMGYEEWGFLVKKDKIVSQKNINSYLTIRSKNPIFIGQHFAMLNQQDITHHTNEEIIDAVDRYGRLISWKGTEIKLDSSLYKHDNYFNYDVLTASPYHSVKFDNSQYSITDGTVTYKDSELATIKDVTDRNNTILGVTAQLRDDIDKNAEHIQSHEALLDYVTSEIDKIEKEISNYGQN